MVELVTSEIALRFLLTANNKKHCDRYMPKVAPIIDIFVRLEACCRVTTTNVNSNCHCSKVETSKLTTVRGTEFRHVW